MAIIQVATKHTVLVCDKSQLQPPTYPQDATLQQKNLPVTQSTGLAHKLGLALAFV